MARKKVTSQDDVIVELLRDLLIVELAKAGVPQRDIRSVVGCDLNRVTRTARFLEKATGGTR